MFKLSVDNKVKTDKANLPHITETYYFLQDPTELELALIFATLYIQKFQQDLLNFEESDFLLKVHKKIK